jgi:hypothetical protein
MSFKINGEQWSNCNKTDDGSLNDFRTVMVQLLMVIIQEWMFGGRNFESSARETFFIRIRNPKVGYITDSPSKQRFLVLRQINQLNIALIMKTTPLKPTSSILPKSIGIIAFLVVNLSVQLKKH